MHPSVQALWHRLKSARPELPTDPPSVFHFCDNRLDADLCAQLVVEGRKRATASSLAELELTGSPLPCCGDLSIVTNWEGEAVAITRTTQVDVRRFADVDEAFAKAEGEGDQTLTWWRKAHRAYYQRILADTSISIDDDLLIACEHFETVLLA